ncbi:MAG TPA: nitrous oxide reductase accessory protein NosL [Trueperaceae bacterium]|nr:nitrous oxide reductase accessory protein NosL [Trueperaceae bacterium]
MRSRKRDLSWPVSVVIALAALAPLLTFVWPLWHYYFEAPQYPEGLAMQIWSSKLTGRVDLINGLNHYVGFMHLDAADFWELRVLPILIVLVSAFGLVAAVVGRKRLFQAWLWFYGIFAVLGMSDFARWLYKFGHTVDPKAAITMDGYTPPMVGTSIFMNFYITAWPGWGAVALAGGFVLALAVFGFRWWRVRARTRGLKVTGAATAAALVVGILLTGCSAPKPVKIVIGQDACASCNMVISDARFASQVVTKTGKAYKFDSVECMIAFLTEGKVPKDQIHSAWVSDYLEPGTWLRAEDAHYLQSVHIRSPMGLNISAYKTLGELENVRSEANGIERRYADLPGIVIEAGFLEKLDSEGGHVHMPLDLSPSPDEPGTGEGGAPQ